MLALVSRAQQGDADAHRTVALHAFNKYKHRVEWLYSRDPAIGIDDLLMTFFEGIMKAVEKLDDRGDPIYHLGQRGVWAVTSELRAIKASMKHRALKPLVYADGEEADPMADYVDPVEVPGSDMVIERMSAEGRVRIIANASLRPRERQALEVIATGAVDPASIGFNKDLADQMGVSPQRTSQVMADLEALVHRAEAGFMDR